MQRYFLKRLLMIVPLILLISFVTFILINLSPSDPAEIALRINDIEITDHVIAEMRTQLGLDQPFLTRYFHWLWNVCHFDLGHSFVNNQSVSGEIFRALPTTIYLALSAFIFILILSIPLALICAYFPNGKLDQSIRALLFIFSAMPNYWVGLLLIWAVSVELNWFPVSGVDNGKGIVLPALALSLGYIGTYFRLLRGTMLNQQQQAYVFYAKARGLSSKRILLRHIFPNSLYSFLVALGMGIPKLLAGSVALENIFALPGLGRLCIQSIFARDYPMIQGYILLMSLLFLVSNFVIDLLQQKFDPRLRAKD